VPDWRDDVCSALDFWIQAEGGSTTRARPVCVGPARQSGERGWYAVDVRGSNANTDQIESFRLAGESGPSGTSSYQVMEAIQDGPLIRVRVAEFVNLASAYLWQSKQSRTHLIVKLREGIASLADPGLAHDLAAGVLAPRPRVVRRFPKFTPMQEEAYESCFTAGVHLVWGPPGTGKTKVLADAIDDLLTAGRRVLLVSATNIAVDGALLRVLEMGHHAAGDVLRVGPPHHPGMGGHPDACLPYLVRQQLAEVEQRRKAVEGRLVAMRIDDDELARLQEAVTGFDQEEYRRAARLLVAEASIPALAEAAAQAGETARQLRQEGELRRNEAAGASKQVDELAPTRAAFAEIDRIQGELTALLTTADELLARAVTSRHRCDQLDAELDRLSLNRVRHRRSIKQLKRDRDDAERGADDLEARAREAADLCVRRRPAVGMRISQLSAGTTGNRADIEAADAAVESALRQMAQADAASGEAEDVLTRRQEDLLAAETHAAPTAAQRILVADADARQLPTLTARLAKLAATIAAANPERTQLEKDHAQVQELFEKLRVDAEGEIIRRARLIATTLARLRTSKALMDGLYDVVLVDEVGAANLPEVLLAVSRAKRTAVLLGDFLQLGPVMNGVVERSDRADIRRWLRPDVFEHCGIRTSQDAQSHGGCTALDVQHRFGPQIMGLANAIAYDGLLKAGDSIRAHADDDPEVVLIDVDGLGDLALVRSMGKHTGWWPAGALLSRVLADYHRAGDRREDTGVITPYRPQAEATLEAFRDQETASADVTEVGTAHRFQGREFPIVVFDMVEEQGMPRQIALASLSGKRYERDGVRLFNVAVTRAQTRLYLIGSGKRVASAPAGTPLAQIASMIRARQARVVKAAALIAPTAANQDDSQLGPFGRELAEVLAEHVRVTDISDERAFYQAFAEQLDAARFSVWIWAPWTANKVRSLLPALAEAVNRGVKVTVFVRDPSDKLQGRDRFQELLADLRAVIHNVVEVNVMHQKIVVIDEETVLLGSLNPLSQNRSREVMITMRGGYFARKVLEHEHATEFAVPPRCGACQGTQVALRRNGPRDWHWRCYSRSCPQWTSNGRSAWTQPALSPARTAAPTAATAGKPGRPPR
jgi:AAA domain-containing protein/phospholipase D-like protein